MFPFLSSQKYGTNERSTVRISASSMRPAMPSWSLVSFRVRFPRMTILGGLNSNFTETLRTQRSSPSSSSGRAGLHFTFHPSAASSSACFLVRWMLKLRSPSALYMSLAPLKLGQMIFASSSVMTSPTWMATPSLFRISCCVAISVLLLIGCWTVVRMSDLHNVQCFLIACLCDQTAISTSESVRIHDQIPSPLVALPDRDGNESLEDRQKRVVHADFWFFGT